MNINVTAKKKARAASAYEKKDPKNRQDMFGGMGCNCQAICQKRMIFFLYLCVMERLL